MMRQPTSAMDEDAVWAVIDTERLALAELIEDLPSDEWSVPSLCDGWRIHDVAAHLALAHMGAGQALRALARAGGSVDRMVRDTARRHASASPGQLAGEIRSMVGSRRLAPAITELEPLIDVLVHGQDIAIPLGRRRSMPVDAAATAATRVWTHRWPLSKTFSVRSRLSGLQLVATDVDWSVGEGPRVEGPIEALLLLLTGRTAALDRLCGRGVGRLTSPGL